MALEMTFDLGYFVALPSLACTLVLSVCFASAQANLAFELQQLVPGLSLNGMLKRYPESLFTPEEPLPVGSHGEHDAKSRGTRSV